jgi:hypothetical protein
MITPYEVDVTKEMAKEGIRQLFEPLKEVILAITKNPASEIGFISQDYLRAFRMRNAFKLFDGVKKRLKNMASNWTMSSHLFLSQYSKPLL